MLYGPQNTIKTTKWNNNCGLASLGHFLQEQLFLEPLPAFFNDPPYQKLLNVFQRVYDDPTLNWAGIHKILTLYTPPIDQSIIWSLPLRAFLQDIFVSDQDYSNKLFIEFQTVVLEILDGKPLPTLFADYPNIIQSNLAYFQAIAHYQAHTPASSLLNKFRNTQTLTRYWQSKGYSNYCVYLHRGDNGSTPMLAATELSLICRFLGIALQIYGPKQGTQEIDFENIQGQTRGYEGPRTPVGTLVLANKRHHWKRVLNDLEKINQHNLHFTDSH